MEENIKKIEDLEKEIETKKKEPTKNFSWLWFLAILSVIIAAFLILGFFSFGLTINRLFGNF